ncbi:MAG: class I adenylate-forming enzyme family protein [Streptosporangiaceae bacterium]
MDPRQPVDDYFVPWDNFTQFFLSRTDDSSIFLIELNHELHTRNEWTVAQWRERVFSAAQRLSDIGIRQGDSVAALAGNTADALTLAYACWVTGACYVPLNFADSQTRLSYIVADSEARALIYENSWEARAIEISRSSTDVVLCTARDLTRGTGDPAEVTARRLQFSSSSLDATALRIYTSGTTGTPKGVVLSAESLLVDADALARVTGWDETTRVITVLPVHHVNGLIISSLLPWFISGSTVLCDRFRTELFWEDVAKESATVCSVVPTLLEFMLSTPAEAPVSFREMVCGAGPLRIETVLDFEQEFQRPVRHLYGLSETTAVVTLMPEMESNTRRYWYREFGFPSIGPAVPHARLAVVDPDGNELGPGARGELVVRGRMVMAEYASESRATMEAFRHGWFHSGDEGFWQPAPGGEPYFFITGRIKELIIRGGVNISPFEVDEILRQHPQVRYALAVPFESRIYGDEIAAYVVAEGIVSEADILTHCARFLDHSKCPKVVIFGEDVPYTATGKAKRLELKQRLRPQLEAYRDEPFRRSATASPE